MLGDFHSKLSPRKASPMHFADQFLPRRYSARRGWSTSFVSRAFLLLALRADNGEDAAPAEGVTARGGHATGETLVARHTAQSRSSSIFGHRVPHPRLQRRLEACLRGVHRDTRSYGVHDASAVPRGPAATRQRGSKCEALAARKPRRGAHRIALFSCINDADLSIPMEEQKDLVPVVAGEHALAGGEALTGQAALVLARATILSITERQALAA